MSNPFYNYSGNFIPGTLARAETSQVEFQAVQAGFSLLVTQGVDSGVAANAYVVATAGQPTGSYADGATVEFKPNFSNTGSSTIAVNSIAAVSILRFNGAVLVAGDLTVGIWTTLTYNAALGAFTITGPGQNVIIPGSISGAPPTHKVGLVAAGGLATSAAPIDATYAIDQSIVPTWIGVHTFSAAPVANAGLTVTGAALTSSAGLTVSAGTSALQTLTATSSVIGAATGGNQGAGTLNATGLFINGVAVTAGTIVTSIAGTAGQIAASASTGAVTLSMPVNVVIPTPASGHALTVNGVASSFALFVQASVTSTHSLGLGIQAGTTSADFALEISNAANTANYFIVWGDGHIEIGSNVGSGTQGLTMGTAGNVVINTPTTTTACPLTVTGPSAAQIGIFNGTAGNCYFDFKVAGSIVGRVGTADSIVVGGTAGDFSVSCTGGALNFATGGSVSRVVIGSSGVVTVKTPDSTAGGFGNYAFNVATPTATNGSFGVYLKAGTSASDKALLINNAGDTQSYLTVVGDGSVIVGQPTTGASGGLGSLNCSALYVNGIAASIATGSFSAGTTGLSGATVACNWSKIGTAVIMRTAVPSGTTSNAVSFTLTGLPAAIQPATTKYAAMGITGLNNGAIVLNVTAQVSGSTITLLLTGNSGGWTATGSKTLGDLSNGVTIVWDVS